MDGHVHIASGARAGTGDASSSRHSVGGLSATLAAVAVAVAAAVLPGPARAAEPAARPLAGNIVSVSGKVMIRVDAAGSAKELRPAQPGKEVFVGDIITTPSDGRVKLLLKDRSIMDIGPSSLFKLDQLKAVAGGQREVDATLPYGSLRAGVTRKLEGKSHFKVRTASATMGVRGTEFVVKSEMGDLRRINQVLSAPPGELPKMDLSGGGGAPPPRTEVTVLQGKVEVGTPRSPKTPDGPAAGPQGGAAGGGAVLTPGMQLVSGGTPPSSEGRGPAGGGGSEVRKLDTQKLSEVASSSRVQDKTFEQAASIQGTTREEEAQAKREERREESRGEAQGGQTAEQGSQSVASAEGEAGSKDGGKDGGEGKRGESSAEGRQEQPAATTADAGSGSADGKGKESAAAGGESRASGAGGGEQRVASDSGSASGGGEQRSSASDGGGQRAPASAPPITSGLAAIAGAVSSNVQTSNTIVQTIRPMDVTVGAVRSTSAVADDSPAVQQIHTLTIQFRPPSANP